MNHGQNRAELLLRIREAVRWRELFGDVPLESKFMQYPLTPHQCYKSMYPPLTSNEIEEEKIRLSTPVSPKQHY